MKKVFSLVLAVFFLATCTACQPTPDEEVVTYKDAKALEEIITTTPAPESTEPDQT